MKDGKISGVFSVSEIETLDSEINIAREIIEMTRLACNGRPADIRITIEEAKND